MIGKVILLIVLVYFNNVQGEADNGLYPYCPGFEGSTIVTDNFLRKNVFFVVQVHYPFYTFRKRYYFGNAIDGIGKDLDFKTRKTFVFVDGYLDSTNMPPPRLAQGIYAVKGYNTIAMDVQLLNSFLIPIAARVNRQIGNITAVVIRGLMKYGLKAKDIELFGISMGGQTASFVAKHFTRLTGEKVGRITALEPTGVCFRNSPPNQRLNPSDADFVQVIHTASEGFGFGAAQGHVDFYINGGEYQFFHITSQPWIDDLFSHLTVFMYYATAHQRYPYDFVGVKCKNVRQAREHRCYENQPHETNVMGPKADPSKPGIYYVPVRAEAPFFAPKDFLETRPNYPLLYNDALNDVENFVLSS